MASRLSQCEIPDWRRGANPVDPHQIMNPIVALLVLVVAALAPVVGQERHAVVRLDDGQKIEGRVLQMDLDLLKIEVGNDVLEIAATRIRSCKFVAANDPASQAVLAGQAEGSQGPGTQGPGTQEPGAQGQGHAAAAEPGSAAAKALPLQKAKHGDSRVTWTAPIQDPVNPHSLEAVPVDMRHRTHWHHRIGMLDSAYPWLVPAAPSQWLSLGLLLLVGSGLIVHLSVHVAGGEKPQLGRSVGLGIWYLITGLLQVAMVPINDLSMALMILVNTSLSLFALCGLFGLPRVGAVVALLVQLGFVVLVHGILELVTALLGSCGVSA